MMKRMIVMLVIVAAVVAVLGFFKFRQVQAAIEQGSSFQPPPEAVTTVVVAEAAWGSTLNAIGTAQAVQGVEVSADLPGVVERISFTSGQVVRRGALLVQLDASQERAQLAAAEARRDLARTSFERLRGLREKGVVAQSELDVAQTQLAATEAGVGEIRAAIGRKTIRAPFAGVLGIRHVDLGQYLSPGEPIVMLQAMQPIYVQFGVPQQQAGRIVAGTPVSVSAQGGDGGTSIGPLTGRVNAVDSVIDPATRNVQVQAQFDNPGAVLKPGMFVEAEIDLGVGATVVPVPASAIAYAPYGDSVYIVEQVEGPDGKSYLGVRQQFVTLGGSRGDQVGVVSGLEPGEQIVTSGVFKLRPGAAVVVNNDVQPGNDPAPTPENS